MMKNSTLKIYESRRKELANLMGPDGIAIIATNRIQTRTNDLHYPFRPSSDFYYLTGFEEPEALALIETNAQGEPKFTLFCREKNEQEEIWNGYRLGPKAAINALGADEAFVIDELDNELIKRAVGKKTIFYRVGHLKSLDKKIAQLMKNGKKRVGDSMPQDLHNLSHYLHEMRLIKNTHEIKLIKKACTLSAKAHNEVMRFAKPNMHEYEIAALFSYVFQKKGGQSGFDTIVGSGKNACILHYIENRDKIAENSLVLCDAGAELNYYNGDITRTWPANGTFAGEQKEIYELVLAAQNAAMEMLQPGLSQNDYHEAAVNVLSQGLIDIGILKCSFDEAIEKRRYSTFYMHRTGHWLGADVHDVGDYKLNGTWRILEKGMVLTVEPGLYIRALDDVDEKWHNIGVRIEDDVLITKNGHENLTSESPKEITSIEELRRQALSK